jgi:NADH dehydrogenase [ubiquinone] 1 alpha subcomplex assembly factor 5
MSRFPFNSSLVWLHKNQSKLLGNDLNYLYKEVSERLYDRILDIKKNFSNALELGNGNEYLPLLVDTEKVSKYTLNTFKHGNYNRSIDFKGMTPDFFENGANLSCFKDNTFDAVFSNLLLHWVNDLPSLFKQIQRILAPDGVFLASVIGGDSLYELRSAFQLAETERMGGISQRMSPMIHMSDIGPLLMDSNFHMITVDHDELVIQYPSAVHLMSDLSSMGESHASTMPSLTIPKKVLLAIDPIYRSLYQSDHISATFQILYMIGWKKGI